MTTLRAHTHARRHAWWPQLYEEYPGIHPSIPLNPGITALLRIVVSTNAYYCAPAWIPVRGGASFRWRLPLSRQPFFSNLRIFFLEVTVSIFRLNIVVEGKSLIVYRSKSSSCLEEENSNREETFPRSIIVDSNRFLSSNSTDLFARMRGCKMRLWRESLPPVSHFRDPSKGSFEGTSVKWTFRSIFTLLFPLYSNRIRDVDVERDHWQLDTLDDWLITSFERNARDELIRRCPLWFSRRKIVEWGQKKKKEKKTSSYYKYRESGFSLDRLLKYRSVASRLNC